jgi:pyridoxal phosphate enzyme (YggS family)
MSLITKNWQVISETINSLAQEFERNAHEISLLAVSKTFDATAVLEAIQAGQRQFGENYVQEAVEKILQINSLLVNDELRKQIIWHFIGPIQSNKTRQIAEHFSWVHSIDREKIAQRLSEQRPLHLPDLQVCIQVNIDDEESKSGVSKQDVLILAKKISVMPRLKLRGLMAVPTASKDEMKQRHAFKQLSELKISIQEQGIMLDTLSMGMSGDLRAAIAEGATIVRIGSSIFGKRDYAK